MRFIERHDVVRASCVLLLIPLLAAIDGCANPVGGDTGGGSPGAGGTGGLISTATAGGADGSTSTGTGSGGAPGLTAIVAVLDDTTYALGEQQNDKLTVFDPATPDVPLLKLSGLTEWGDWGASRKVATSNSKKRLGVMEPPTLRVFDENLQPLANVALPNENGYTVCPTEQAIFVLLNEGTNSSGTILKFDSNGSYLATTFGSHGVDLVVDEDNQVVWTVGTDLTRATTDLLNEEQLHTFGWMAVSLDLDGNGGIWAAERKHSQIPESVDRLVHFDVNGNIINDDTLTLTPVGSPLSVRVDRNSGLVWVAMLDKGGGGGVAYRDVNGELKKVPGLTGTWNAVEPDPLDGSRAWAASKAGVVVHVDTDGTLIQSLGGFSPSQKWLAVLLQGSSQ